MIRFKNVSKCFSTDDHKVQALEHVNLDIERGDIFGVIGLSGAGKSTLIRVINGLEVIDQGSITVDDVKINGLTASELNEQRKSIGMIFQHFNLLSSRNVFGNVSLPLELIGTKKSERERRIIELLDLVGLNDKIHTPISQLSGGQKQRVAIARALATSPQVLLCDEATSALDPKTTKEVLKLIKTLQEQLKITVVLITHEMNVIKEICNKVAVIEAGHIIESGYVSQMFDQPKESITRSFVKAV